jgi:hypothetical protein
VLTASTRQTIQGHFAPCAWRAGTDKQGHELAIAPHLFDTPKELLGTLLHEAAHGLLFEWGLNGGCGPDGYYHREEFRNVGRKLGLTCEFSNRRYGWNMTCWPNNTVPGRYRAIAALLRRDLPWGKRGRTSSSDVPTRHRTTAIKHPTL